MPLVYQQNINECTQMGVWHITEDENFFLKKVTLQKEITHWHKRLQHLAGRYLLTELQPTFPIELIKIADTRKPFLENEAYHFSISHCGNYAAVIVSKKYRVGVDVEAVREKIDRIIPKFLTAEESFLLPRGAITKTATLFWSAKECIYKWEGEGGVDFKKHIAIKQFDDEKKILHCTFKHTTALLVHYLFFSEHYLSWVLSNR